MGGLKEGLFTVENQVETDGVVTKDPRKPISKQTATERSKREVFFINKSIEEKKEIVPKKETC